MIAVGTCAFLAGTFLTADAMRSGHAPLAEQLRRRTLVVGAATGTLVFLALIPIMRDAPTLSSGRRTSHPGGAPRCGGPRGVDRAAGAAYLFRLTRSQAWSRH